MRTILSIDGGGMFGLVPALVLSELERELGGAVGARFDLVAGTSTGAIIGCGLCRPDPVPASDIARFYSELGPRIFTCPAWKRVWNLCGVCGPRYPDDALRRALDGLLGGIRLSEVGWAGGEPHGPALLVAAYDVVRGEPYYFKSHRAGGPDGEPARDFALTDVALSTSAAPTYFPAVRAIPGEGDVRCFIDGGVHNNSPVDSAVAEARRLWPGEELRVLSLGTGARLETWECRKARRWGLVHVASLVKVMMDGASEASLYRARNQPGVELVRVDTGRRPGELASTDMDDASPEQIEALTRLGRMLWNSERQRLLDFFAAGG